MTDAAEKSGNVVIVLSDKLRAVFRAGGSVVWEWRTQFRLRPWEWRPVNVRVSPDRGELRLSVSDYIETDNRCARATYKEIYTRQ